MNWGHEVAWFFGGAFLTNDTALYQHISHLATFDAGLGDVRDAAIYVRGNSVEWVGPTADLPPALQAADRVVSCEGLVVIPGLVNTHHHM